MIKMSLPLRTEAYTECEGMWWDCTLLPTVYSVPTYSHTLLEYSTRVTYSSKSARHSASAHAFLGTFADTQLQHNQHSTLSVVTQALHTLNRGVAYLARSLDTIGRRVWRCQDAGLLIMRPVCSREPEKKKKKIWKKQKKKYEKMWNQKKALKLPKYVPLSI